MCECATLRRISDTSLCLCTRAYYFIGDMCVRAPMLMLDVKDFVLVPTVKGINLLLANFQFVVGS